MIAVNVIASKGGIMAENKLFVSNDDINMSYELASKAEDYFRDIVRKEYPKTSFDEMEYAIEDGHFDRNGFEVVISWPDIKKI